MKTAAMIVVALAAAAAQAADLAVRPTVRPAEAGRVEVGVSVDLIGLFTAKRPTRRVSALPKTTSFTLSGMEWSGTCMRLQRGFLHTARSQSVFQTTRFKGLRQSRHRPFGAGSSGSLTGCWAAILTALVLFTGPPF